MNTPLLAKHVKWLYCVSLLCPCVVAGQVPHLINYQGRLTAPNGDPVSGSRNFIVNIFDAATNGKMLYSEDVGSVTLDNNGVYNFQFGTSGSSTTENTEEIAVTSVGTLTYSKQLSQASITPNSIVVSDGTNQWIQSVGNAEIQATATANITNGFITGVTITNGGTGYTSAPAVTFTGNGTGATASATIASGSVNSINVTNAGFGYSEVFTTITPPMIPFRVNVSGGTVEVIYASQPVAGHRITATYRYLDNSIEKALTNSTEQWLQLNIQGQDQSPRQRILTVPYALKAAKADQATSALSATTASTVVDGAITAEKLAPTAVATSLANQGNFIVSGTERPDLVSAGFELLSFAQPVEFTPISGIGAPQTNYNYDAAIWTGTEMIIFSGDSATSARYNPTSNTWSPINAQGAPSARANYTAIWTGTEMIIWGGQMAGTFLNTGGRYNPISNSWTPINTQGAPSSRQLHTAIWTGSEMIIWGGGTFSYGNINTNTGGRYNLTTDTWLPLSTQGAPSARANHTAVWTGTEMIIWGGYGSAELNSGSRYNAMSNSWIPIELQGAPSPRYEHDAIWTGSEMIIWGVGGYSDIKTTGKRYNPVTNTWNTLSSINSPVDKDGSSAVWTGEEMVVWGGDRSNQGDRYNPNTDKWTATSTLGAPSGRQGHLAVWTGTEMIIWGGTNDYGIVDGARYRSRKNLYFYGKP